MTKGIFQIISESYQIGANNLFDYCSEVPLIFKPFFYGYALVGFLVLYVCSIAFYILIIFDVLSRVVNSIRNALLNSIKQSSYKSQFTLGGFIFNPTLIALLTPIFILSALLPKISAELDIDEFTGEALEKFNITGSGTFRKIINYSMETISNLFSYIKSKSILALPFLLIPCVFNILLMLMVIIVATPLTILDLLSYVVDAIRNVCIQTSRKLGQSTESGLGGFLFSPVIMVILVPVFIAVLIIPKFSTGIDGVD